jgi:hypothetical protein
MKKTITIITLYNRNANYTSKLNHYASHREYLANSSSSKKATFETIFHIALGKVPGPYATQHSKKPSVNTAVPVDQNHDNTILQK